MQECCSEWKERKQNTKFLMGVQLARCQCFFIGFEELRRKGASSLLHQLQPWDLFATFELPGPKWRLPDGEIPEANIKVHTGEIRGEAERNPNQLFWTNPAESLREIEIC